MGLCPSGNNPELPQSLVTPHKRLRFALTSCKVLLQSTWYAHNSCKNPQPREIQRIVLMNYKISHRNSMLFRSRTTNPQGVSGTPLTKCKNPQKIQYLAKLHPRSEVEVYALKSLKQKLEFQRQKGEFLAIRERWGHMQHLLPTSATDKDAEGYEPHRREPFGQWLQ